MHICIHMYVVYNVCICTAVYVYSVMPSQGVRYMKQGIDKNTYIHMYVYIHTCVCTYMHMYTYICMYVYICT